jgi:hypothetical protein
VLLADEDADADEDDSEDPDEEDCAASCKEEEEDVDACEECCAALSSLITGRLQLLARSATAIIRAAILKEAVLIGNPALARQARRTQYASTPCRHTAVR